MIDPDLATARLAEECVDVYTNAPKAYDYWYTREVEARAAIDTSGKTWRRVQMPASRVPAQSDRYRSGWHAAMPPREFAIMRTVWR